MTDLQPDLQSDLQTDLQKEEALLVKRCLAGDEEAVDILVGRYRQQVYAIAFRMTRDRCEAMDITQNTFIKAFKGMSGFRWQSSFKSWLCRIAVNACKDALNSNAHRQQRQHLALDESMVATGTSPLCAVINKEERLCLAQALQALPYRQKSAVILRVYAELSIRETALAMGCSEGAVKAHYHNAIKRLKEAVHPVDWNTARQPCSETTQRR